MAVSTKQVFMALSPKNSVVFFSWLRVPTCRPSYGSRSKSKLSLKVPSMLLFFCGYDLQIWFQVDEFFGRLSTNSGHKTFPNHQAKPTATHYVNQVATEKRIWWIQMAWINLDACSVSRKLETCLQTRTAKRKLIFVY